MIKNLKNLNNIFKLKFKVKFNKILEKLRNEKIIQSNSILNLVNMYDEIEKID